MKAGEQVLHSLSPDEDDSTQCLGKEAVKAAIAALIRVTVNILSEKGQGTFEWD
ncbi:MAG: hypothetical protein F6J95_030675 [Leptolyngbya sp. SIO1E4]|nr:hypothetical protein [Leptolyngbya sp. SIO1E4]